jgi:YHS domain-containing protein
MSRDPVCKSKVEEKSAIFKSQYGGETYYFCSQQCVEQFEDHPEKYAVAA